MKALNRTISSYCILHAYLAKLTSPLAEHRKRYTLTTAILLFLYQSPLRLDHIGITCYHYSVSERPPSRRAFEDHSLRTTITLKEIYFPLSYSGEATSKTRVSAEMLDYRGARLRLCLEKIHHNDMEFVRNFFEDYARTGFHIHGQPAILENWMPKNASMKRFLDSALAQVIPTGCNPCIRLLMDRGAEMVLDLLPPMTTGLLELPSFILDKALQTPTISFTRKFPHVTIQEACQWEHTQLFNALLAEGVDLGSEDEFDLTVLHIAAANSNKQMCIDLLENGADPNQKGWKDTTPLTFALCFDHKDIVKVLLSKNGNPNHIGSNLVDGDDSHECSAMHLAASLGNFQILEWLIEAGGNLSTKDTHGNNVLDLAFKNSHIALCFHLLKKGAALFQPDSSVASQLLTIAIAEHEHDVVELLIRAGVVDQPHQIPSQITRYERYDFTHSILGHIIGKNETLGLSSSLILRHLLLCPACKGTLCRLDWYETVPYQIGGTELDINAVYVTGLFPLCQLCRLFQDNRKTDSARFQPPPKLRYFTDSATRWDLLGVKVHDWLFHQIKKIPDDWHRFLLSIGGLEDSDTSSIPAMAMSHRWLRCCIEDHGACNMDLSSQYSPSRIIDVERFKSFSEVKLIEGITLNEPYIALSHRWGETGLPQTTTLNIKDRLHGIPASELSRTIQDAIWIVYTLGFRYLWVDALCIVQDSSSDWSKEATKMSSIYKGAILTLAVADSENHNQGIFRKRKVRCLRPFPIERSGEINYIFPATDQVFQHTRPRGPLDSRGWVLQEQILSPRILYFGQGELFWDCVTMSASESSPISASLLTDRNSDETWAFKFLRRTITAASPNSMALRERIAVIWMQVIVNYSARQLSQSSDKLMAMQGILSAIEAILDEEQIGGMWREGLWHQLLWWSARAPKSSETECISQGFIAPSWSWLSCSNPVFYHNSLSKGHSDISSTESKNFTELHPLVNRIDANTRTSPQNAGLHGILSLSASSFGYILRPEDFKEPVWKRWNKKKFILNPGRWILDIPQPSSALEVCCVIMAEDPVAKILICLCLVPTGDPDGSFRRIGLCHWDGLIHQVINYAKEEPVERDFRIV
ncbi:hypothetical protein B0J11DRAFT_544129 [Dendryphion nanum]|uniref:Heterokaryon incompatibility domain-containing protein n=1 Tax=Dendryphion nanum TaxID=256645 RepID=A0A9P9I8I3_9PLEO|nr:hypothetical protein B0J11DRAFT_544129 [Dendryphion nanum]